MTVETYEFEITLQFLVQDLSFMARAGEEQGDRTYP